MFKQDKLKEIYPQALHNQPVERQGENPESAKREAAHHVSAMTEARREQNCVFKA